MNRQFEAPLAQHVRVFVPGPGEHFTLPSEVTKAGAIAMIAAAMRLMKAKPIEVLVFRLIADRTERVAWHSGERAPVNWRRQCDLAREAGISERHFRRIEARLVQMGVLARATADNGYRGRRAGQPWNSPVQCGLSLEPAIANYAAFVAMVAAADAIEDQRQEVLFHIRTARRRLHALAAAAPDIETRSWAEDAIGDLCGDLPSGILRGLELDPLLAHHAAILDLEDLIREASTPLPHPEAARRHPMCLPMCHPVRGPVRGNVTRRTGRGQPRCPSPLLPGPLVTQTRPGVRGQPSLPLSLLQNPRLWKTHGRKLWKAVICPAHRTQVPGL